jgi:Phage integrase family
MTSFWDSWHKARQQADLHNFRFHDLRHTFASYLAMSGANLLAIAELLGHKRLEMVKRYAHLSEAHMRGVVERMNRDKGSLRPGPVPRSVGRVSTDQTGHPDVTPARRGDVSPKSN